MQGLCFQKSATSVKSRRRIVCYDRNVNEEQEAGKEAAYQRRRAEMLRLMERHLRAEETAPPLAEQVFLSRFHFGRVFRHVVGETPGGMERRLRMERAASELRDTRRDVTEIAFDAGYESLEGFSRAFRRAYGLPPSHYREQTAIPANLPGLSQVHYDPQTRGLCVTPPQGKPMMDLTDRLLDNDYWTKKHLLEAARALSDAQLDAPLAFRHNLMPFSEPEKTLREALIRMTSDHWIIEMMDAAGWASLGGSYRQIARHSVPDMIARTEGFHKDYAAFTQKVKAENLWETEWVDAACEPAETFTYGTTIEESLTMGIAQRMVVQRLLEQIGLQPEHALGW